MTDRCEWCDAEILEDCGSLCEDCKAVDLKQAKLAEERVEAYWRHVNLKIDEARGK